jgi:hypothetical protein
VDNPRSRWTGGGRRVCHARGVPSPLPPPPSDFPREPWAVASVPPEAPEGDLAFTCPRCRRDVTEAAYGPCTPCRAELRGLGGEARDIVEADYVPKMNVTPNAVALKD